MMPVCVIVDPGATWRIPGEPYDTSWERMLNLIQTAKDAGCQVFKPQYYQGATLYGKGTPGDDIVRPYELPREWLPRIKAECDSHGLEFMCTVYTPEDVAVVDPYVQRMKVASFENHHTRLLETIARTGKPVIISTGMLKQGVPLPISPEYDLDETYLHCVSAYPAPPEQMNLRCILSRNTNPLVGGGMMGLSDHTDPCSSTAAVIAVAYGAMIIERHIRAWDTPENNPDYPHSCSPAQLQRYVQAIRTAEAMLGDGVKRVMPSEAVQWKYDPTLGRRGS